LCLKDKWVNVTGLEVGHETRSITLMTFNSYETTVDVDVNGEVSEYLRPSSTTLKFTDSRDLILNYSIVDEGEFEGNVTFSSVSDTVTLMTELSSSAEKLVSQIEGPQTVSLGTILSGETVERQIYLNNTGDLDVTDLSASSSNFDASIDSESVAAGENKVFTLELTEVTQNYGTVDMVGNTQEEEVSAIISIDANVQTERDVSALESRIEQLRSRVETTSQQSKLDSVETKISNIEDLYDEGEYEDANQKYDEATSELDQIETQLSNSGSVGETGEQTNKNNDGGGMVVPIVVAVFVFILLGFIFYTSYVPEEGDPLYDLMGE